MNSLPAHPKILSVGDRAAWLYVCGLCYSNEHLTDGHIPRSVLVVAAPGVKAPEKLAKLLVDVGLWDVVADGWQVHDYGDYQRTSVQVKETRRKDRERKAATESGDTFRAESRRNPDGIRADSGRIPDGPSRDARANPAQEKRREEKNYPPDPPGGKVVTFRKRAVPAERVAIAERALAVFNRSAGQNVGAYRGDGRPSEALTLIIGAVTDKPEKLTGDYCERLVVDVFQRRWWGNDPASVGVVFGPKVIDRNIAALDGANGSGSMSSREIAQDWGAA